MKTQFGLIIAGAFALFIFIVIISSAFIITEVDQAIIIQFGRPVRVIAGDSPFTERDALKKSVEEYSSQSNSNVKLSFGAGLYFKIPFMQQIEYFEDRILESDADPARITTGDQKRILVDSFARWLIANPLKFRQTLVNMPTALNRLDNIIRSNLRNRLGECNFIEIIRSTNQLLDTEIEIPEQKKVAIEIGRSKIMEDVTKMCRATAKDFGIYIIDVRIKRADPPEQNMEAIFENMKAERDRIAEKYRAEGQRQATFIMANTDRQVKIMRAEADRDAQIIMGKADAEAARIYARGFIKDVTGQPSVQIHGFESDPEFFRFTRSLEALEKSVDNGTSLILNTNSDLLQFMKSPMSGSSN